MSKLTKSEIEEKYWVEFVKWAKDNKELHLRLGAGVYYTDRPLTKEEFWSWYQQYKLAKA